ncbi:GroES-like protein [Glarea lozoyensis ATCC 20868]|uniref:GroES-like protein n=2 Tax=Glarea lozoyensis TaxID=101852 RepID=S3D2E3_GLAL2|nr:GroES-like protein [Glarea lozoyensis ATCC 20868]EHK96978.1 putative Zinc-binding alcohol dehydrogenase domain-containing protein cipB [Glarea lozoyensis 74030]EPE32702.1 GroES-like protein [Glarea lozoyensis ATCC 20868]
MPTNTAAWLVTEKASFLEVKQADYTSPSDNEIVVKNHAVALNIVDFARQFMGNALFPWDKYPCILGSDVAGEVQEVGTSVKNFKVGDRVLGMAVGLKTGRPADAAFQAYTVLPAHMASSIPSSVSFEDAAVIPLAISTAACGMYQKEYLALQHPTAPRRQDTGETILIWGGASSVGTNAIQMAIASGYDVISTASPKNWDYVQKLGVNLVFDYHSDTVVSDIVKAFDGKKSAGALSIGQGATSICAEIVSKIGGKQFVASASPLPPQLPEGVASKFIFGSDLKDNEVGPAIYVDFIPAALKDGSFVPSPPSRVVGKGLEDIQKGLNELTKGVSAEKLVVTLE